MELYVYELRFLKTILFHDISYLTGARRETQKGRGGANIEKIYSFCEILTKMSQNEGGAKDLLPPSIRLRYLRRCQVRYLRIDTKAHLCFINS